MHRTVAAMAIAIAGQGMALSSDYVIGVAPSISAKAAGAAVSAAVVADRALVLSLITGGIALVAAYLLVRRFKPEHPDVAHQKRVIADLQKQVDEELASRQVNGPVVPVVDRAQAARLNRILQARTEIESLNSQIDKKEKDLERLRGVVVEYQARVEAAPT